MTPIPESPIPSVEVIQYQMKPVTFGEIATEGIPENRVVIHLDDDQADCMMRLAKMISEKKKWNITGVKNCELIIHNQIELQLIRQCRQLINDTNKLFVDQMTNKFAKAMGTGKKKRF
jgi:bifunctional pyridoxal-dependent enzyme with beta-cystathionase and maltose regulon repressor activities